MKANSEGASWSRDTKQVSAASILMSQFTQHAFLRSDGKAVAVEGYSVLTFKTAHWANLEERAGKE